jgi:hypothetical protein
MIRSRTIHKWIGVVIGLALLMWTITGIIMALPGRRVRETSVGTIDLSRATIAPVQALARLADRDSASPVRAVSLIQILDHVVYRAETARRTLLVNAENGQPFEITPAIAEGLARRSIRGTVGEATVERLTTHDSRYASGDLPAYRVTLNGAATVAYVSARDGSVIQGDSRRLRSIVGKLHDFSAIKLLISADWVHRALAIGTCSLAIIGILTGYWLALYRPRRPMRNTEPASLVTSDR